MDDPPKRFSFFRGRSPTLPRDGEPTPADAAFPGIAEHIETFKSRFNEPRATFIQHRPEKCEVRFRANPARALAFAAIGFVVPMTVLIGIPYVFGWVGFQIVTHDAHRHYYLAIVALGRNLALVIFPSAFIARFVYERAVYSCGIIANLFLRNFTLHRQNHIASRETTTVTLHDTREFIRQPDARLALVAKGGRKIPFTPPFANPDSADALRAFLQHFLVPGLPGNPRWQPADPPPPTPPVKLFKKQHGSTPLRFSKRNSRKPAKFPNQRRFSP